MEQICFTHTPFVQVGRGCQGPAAIFVTFIMGRVMLPMTEMNPKLVHKHTQKRKSQGREETGELIRFD